MKPIGPARNYPAQHLARIDEAAQFFLPELSMDNIRVLEFSSMPSLKPEGRPKVIRPIK